MLHDLLFRMQALFRRRAMEADLDEELRAHLEHEVEKHLGAGLSAEEAERQARIDFGNFEQVKDACRRSWGVQLADELLAEARHGVRQVRRNPVFSTVAALALVFGVAANTMLFDGLATVVQRVSPRKVDAPRVQTAQNFVPKPVNQIEAAPRRAARKVTGPKPSRTVAPRARREKHYARLAPPASEKVSMVTAGFVFASGAGAGPAAAWTARYEVERRNGFVLIRETWQEVRPAAGVVVMEMTIHSGNAFYTVVEVTTRNPENPQRAGWKPLILNTQPAISNPTQDSVLAVTGQSGQCTSVSGSLAHL
jgi:putative ABC transport system permease protein